MYVTAFFCPRRKTRDTDRLIGWQKKAVKYITSCTSVEWWWNCGFGRRHLTRGKKGSRVISRRQVYKYNAQPRWSYLNLPLIPSGDCRCRQLRPTKWTMSTSPFIHLSPALLFRAQRSIRITPALFSRSSAQSSSARAFSAKSSGEMIFLLFIFQKSRNYQISVFSRSQSKSLVSMFSQSGDEPHRFYEPRA